MRWIVLLLVSSCAACAGVVPDDTCDVALDAKTDDAGLAADAGDGSPLRDYSRSTPPHAPERTSLRGSNRPPPLAVALGETIATDASGTLVRGVARSDLLAIGPRAEASTLAETPAFTTQAPDVEPTSVVGMYTAPSAILLVDAGGGYLLSQSLPENIGTQSGHLRRSRGCGGPPGRVELGRWSIAGRTLMLASKDGTGTIAKFSVALGATELRDEYSGLVLHPRTLPIAQRPLAPATRVETVFAAYRDAQRLGKPVLVLLVPDGQEALMKFGSAIGEWLNDASDELMVALAMTHLVFGSMTEVRALLDVTSLLRPMPRSDRPMMMFVETDQIPATMYFIGPQMRADADRAPDRVDARRAASAAVEALIAQTAAPKAQRLLRKALAAGTRLRLRSAWALSVTRPP